MSSATLAIFLLSAAWLGVLFDCVIGCPQTQEVRRELTDRGAARAAVTCVPDGLAAQEGEEPRHNPQTVTSWTR